MSDVVKIVVTLILVCCMVGDIVIIVFCTRELWASRKEEKKSKKPLTAERKVELIKQAAQPQLYSWLRSLTEEELVFLIDYKMLTEQTVQEGQPR